MKKYETYKFGKLELYGRTKTGEWEHIMSARSTQILDLGGGKYQEVTDEAAGVLFADSLKGLKKRLNSWIDLAEDSSTRKDNKRI